MDYSEKVGKSYSFFKKATHEGGSRKDKVTLVLCSLQSHIGTDVWNS